MCIRDRLNKDGYRYLQDYGLGPPDPSPRNKAMELGPRDRLSQAFWHEKQKGRTVKGPHGDVVHLDLRHLGEQKLRERLGCGKVAGIEAAAFAKSAPPANAARLGMLANESARRPQAIAVRRDG